MLATNTHTDPYISSPVYQSNYARSLQTQYQPIEHIQTGEIPRLPTLTYKPPLVQTQPNIPPVLQTQPNIPPVLQRQPIEYNIPLHNI